MTSLVIVESPAKCKKIQEFLGPGWRVEATMGHIRALEEDLEAVGLERDFEPRYSFIKEKSKAIHHLKEAAKEATRIYIAADDDREGEAIAYSVAVLLKLDPKIALRSVFHEITKEAVVNAIKNPRTIDLHKVEAQQARSILDLMVGFTISPLLWKHVGAALSAGRCQTPALRLLCDKEKEIQGFTSETVWRVKGSWIPLAGNFIFPADLKDELDEKESALNFLENLHEETEAEILTASTKAWTDAPPKPLITSTLQQEASALYSSPPKRTMQIAQKLYEGGHITYMRTDHAILSEEAVADATQYIQKHFGDEYLGSAKAKKIIKTEVKAQEAHEAIRPTHFDLSELSESEDWLPLERKIYRLIWARATQSCMAAAKGDTRTIVFIASGDPGEFPWQATWKRTTFLGWKKIGLSLANLDDEEDSQQEAAQATWLQALALKEGTKLKWKTLETAPQVSTPKPRFTEATLVRELEKKGIGRPSTYASLVGTLLDKKYTEKRDKPASERKFSLYSLKREGQWPPTEESITKKVGGEKDKLVPTALGLSLLEFCMREFGPLFDYGFTAQMESRLDSVAEGKEPWKNVCRDTWNSYKDHYLELKGQKGSVLGKVKEFTDGLKAVQGKKGPILLREDPSGDKEKTTFYGWPEGLSFSEITQEVAIAFCVKVKESTEGKVIGLLNGQPMIEKSGKFGPYVQWGSVNVPKAEGDTVFTLQEKLKAKDESNLHTLGDFIFRKGQYGPFMFKKGGVGRPQFVSLPEGLDPKLLTLEAATRIYQNGVTANGNSQRGRGRGRGRGK
jgi:DNA topoisomerase-1